VCVVCILLAGRVILSRNCMRLIITSICVIMMYVLASMHTESVAS